MIGRHRIIHVSYDGYLVTIHSEDGPIDTTMSLATLADELQGAHWVRVHRRHILNLNQVTRLESIDSGGYIAHMSNGDCVPVSRQAARDFRRQKKTQ